MGSDKYNILYSKSNFVTEGSGEWWERGDYDKWRSPARLRCAHVLYTFLYLLCILSAISREMPVSEAVSRPVNV
jgi:hypothetical protein